MLIKIERANWLAEMASSMEKAIADNKPRDFWELTRKLRPTRVAPDKILETTEGGINRIFRDHWAILLNKELPYDEFLSYAPHKKLELFDGEITWGEYLQAVKTAKTKQRADWLPRPSLE